MGWYVKVIKRLMFAREYQKLNCDELLLVFAFYTSPVTRQFTARAMGNAHARNGPLHWANSRNEFAREFSRRPSKDDERTHRSQSRLH